MSQDWIAREIGALTATVSVGLQEVHRRIDDRHREVMFHIRRLDKPRKSNGHGKPMWLHVASLLTAYGLMLLSIIKPEAAGAVLGAAIRQLMH